MRGVMVMAGGWVLIAVGLALLVLPGPGIPVLFAGLTVLAPRYHWARRSIEWMRRRWAHVANRWHAAHPKRGAEEEPRPPEPPAS